MPTPPKATDHPKEPPVRLDSTAHNESLLKKIGAKRSEIAAYLSRTEPTAMRLTTVTTLCSATAGILTATLTKVLGDAPKFSPTWRWLSLGATVCSGLAIVTNQWYKSRNYAANISKARTADAKLEALATLIEIGQIPLKDSGIRYEKCVLEVPFVILPTTTAPWWRGVPLERVEGKIKTPTSGQPIAETIPCAGTATGLQPGVHLWLAVESSGRIWPRETEVTVKPDGSWAKTLFEDGTLPTFAVSLYVVGPKGHRTIKRWLDSCASTGSYPELHRTRHMPRLDWVTGLTRNQPDPPLSGRAPDLPEHAQGREPATH